MLQRRPNYLIKEGSIVMMTLPNAASVQTTLNKAG